MIKHIEDHRDIIKELENHMVSYELIDIHSCEFIIATLIERQERSKGCEVCNGREHLTSSGNFCANCGRRFKESFLQQ